MDPETAPENWTWRTINPAARRIVDKVREKNGLLSVKVVARSLHGDRSFEMDVHNITNNDDFNRTCRWATTNHNLFNRDGHDLSDWRIMIECYASTPLLPHKDAELDDEPVFIQAMETRPGVFAEPNIPRSDPD